MILVEGTVPEGCSLLNNNSTFLSVIYTFPWRETKLFTRKIKVQTRRSTLIIIPIKAKMPTLVGKKQLTVHFSPLGLRLFHLSTETVRVQSVRNGYQTGYSRPKTIDKNINKRCKKFSITGN